MKRLLLILSALASIAASQVAVSLSPVPRLQFFDTNGQPCAGCLLYTYAAGTTTPQATYIDSTGTYQNANPVVLDSMGSASVWLSAASYKLVLTTASGSTIFSVDNIKGSDSTYLRLDGTNSPVTGAVTFNAATNLTAGGAMGGIFTGSPTISGPWNFTGTPSFTALDFGLATSESANPAQSGLLRFGALDQLCWRNAANGADICLAKNAQDQLAAPAFASSAANAAQSGVLALASGDQAPCWRNAAGTADICLGHNASDELTYNGNVIAQPTPSVPVIYTAANASTVSDTTSQTAIQAVTYGVGDINAVGRTIHLATSLWFTNGTGSAQNVDVALTLGSIRLFDRSVSVGTSGGVYLIDWWGVVSTAGTSGGIGSQGSITSAGGALTFNTGDGGPTTINTTSAQALSLLITLPVASTQLSVVSPFMVAKIQ